jgi:hypothetical protein
MSAKSPLFDNDTIPTDAGLTALQYMEIVREINDQPDWRAEAMMCAGFFDGKQLTPKLREEIEARGMMPIIDNKVKPLVNAMLGAEVRARTDWRVSADGDDMQDMAEALSFKLNEAKRETMADLNCSDAFGEQIKAGLGWVQVTRNADPFGYEYRVEQISFDEVWWDWRAKRRDLSDARYQVRQAWYPTASVMAAFPKKAEIVRAAAGGWMDIDLDLSSRSPEMEAALFESNSYGNWDGWVNDQGRSVLVREVWYRVFVRGKVIRFPSGRKAPFDERNPVHEMAHRLGLARVMEAAYAKMRAATWVGPHKLQDVDCGQTPFPYVPFWGYRETGSRVPYGIIRDLVPTQMEINARRQKMGWLLSSKRVIAESDALDRDYNDLEDLAGIVSRPDAMVVVKSGRLGAVRYESDMALSSAQMQVMQEASDSMQRTAGIYNSMLGTVDSQATSGRAIASLVEQGNILQASINDNYRFAREQVGDRLLRLIVEDMTGQAETVMVRRADSSTKPVRLNWPSVDEATGMDYRENDVSKTMWSTSLSDVPISPAYRAQSAVMLSEVIKGLPPQLQALLVPSFLRATDLPQREDMARLAEKAAGIGQEEDAEDPEKQQMRELIAQGAQMVEQLQKALADKEAEETMKAQEAEAHAAEMTARAAEARARAAKANAETERIEMENDLAQQGVEGIAAEAASAAAQAALATAYRSESA